MVKRIRGSSGRTPDLRPHAAKTAQLARPNVPSASHSALYLPPSKPMRRSAGPASRSMGRERNADMLATSPAKSNRWCGVAGRPGLWNCSSNAISNGASMRSTTTRHSPLLRAAIITQSWTKACGPPPRHKEIRSQGADGALRSGLAAWRSGDYARSAENFEMLSAAALEDDWIESAAAFWAARAYLAARQPARVNSLLAKAAQKPRTFYGLLAARALGEIPVFEWELPKLGTVEMSLLSQAPAARRALIQVGETTRESNQRFTGSLSPELARSFSA